MKLDIYSLYNGESMKIREAPLERQWMDSTDQKYAYRCLPLNIANQYGWQFLNRYKFSAHWNGQVGIDDITIQYEDPSVKEHLVASHFGYGILTFTIPYVIRTEKNYDVMATGPTNSVKSKIQPLQGIVETDWLEFTFTMNWKFTEPGIVTFEEDEPICQFYPIEKNLIEKFEPRILQISDNKNLLEEHRKWGESRSNFIKNVNVEGTEENKQGWQKTYFKGMNISGEKADNHLTKVKVCPVKKVIE